MAYELTLAETADWGIRRVIVEHLDETIQELQTTPEGPHKAVHNARKSCKRIRAGLRLVRDALGEEIYRQENAYYRDVSRRLAEVRDSLVIVHALDALAIHFAEEVTPGAFDEMRQALFARHKTLDQEIIGDGQILTGVAEALQAGRERVLAWPLQGDSFELFAPGLTRVYRRGRRRMKQAYATGEAHTFHDWRKRVKYLWYQLEILRPIWPGRLDSLVEDLQQLSDYLGDAHDLVALGQVLVEELAVSREDPALAQLLILAERWQDDFEAAARPLGARVFLEKPGQFTATMKKYWQLWRAGVVIGEGPSLAAIRAEVTPAGESGPHQTAVGEFAPTLLSTSQAAEQLGLSLDQVRRLIRRGRLPATKLGSFWVIHEADLPSAGGQPPLEQ